jgi:hypothetical protein
MKTYDPHKSTVEARAGDSDPTNRWPLIVGTVVVVIAFAIIWWWFAVYGGGNSINHGA